MLNIYDLNNYVHRHLAVDKDPLQLVIDAYEALTPSIWVADGFNSRKKRREIYPEYKKNRDKEKRHENTLYEYMEFFKTCLLHTNNFLLEIPEYEADDVIAHLAKNYAPCHIYSNDSDLYTLLQYPGVTYDGKVFYHSPKANPLFKAVVGDPSDNIPGVRGVGVTRFIKWIEEGIQPPQMEDPENKKLVELFLKVVDFLPIEKDMIDRHLKKGVKDAAKIREELKKTGMVSAYAEYFG